MRIWLELNQKEGEQVFNLFKEFSVDRMKTAVMGAPKENKSTEDKLPTLGEVRMKLATLAQDGKQAEVKALITEFGARKLSDIPADRYPELLEKVSEL